MSTTTPERIVELWPSLPEEARIRLVEWAESAVAASGQSAFTPEELAGIRRGREDFKSGRTSSLPEYRADMDAFFDRLKAKATLTASPIPLR